MRGTKLQHSSEKAYIPTTGDTELDRVYLSVILPLYNEEHAISELLETLISVLQQDVGTQYEIIVVDDGSTDRSVELVRSADHSTITIAQHPYNIGNGAAIKTGIRRARGKYILMMDADGQHSPQDICHLLEYSDRYDMVVGARTQESDTDTHRDLANWTYNMFATYVCGQKIEDLTSGFRIVRTDVAKSFVYLLPNTFSYPSTITLAVIRAGHSLKYVPITVSRRLGNSKINIVRDGVRFLTIILRIAVFFSPLKVFVPLSVLFFSTGFVWYLYRVFIEHHGFPPVSSLLMITSVLIFLIGLVSEQITYLRYQER